MYTKLIQHFSSKFCFVSQSRWEGPLASFESWLRMRGGVGVQRLGSPRRLEARGVVLGSASNSSRIHLKHELYPSEARVSMV
jgi:hypothetical protein